MKKMARGAMAVLTMIGMNACVSDPQDRINNDDFKTLQAYPEVAFIRSDVDSSAVYFRLINDYGNGTPTHLELKGVTGTIRVRQDTTFRRYYTNGNPNPDPSDSAAIPYLDGHLQRWYVFTNRVSGEGTFTLTASNGAETTVHVRVEAANLGTLPTQTAVPGQIITLTAPPFQKFTPDAQVTYLRGAVPLGYPCTVTAGVQTGTCVQVPLQTVSDPARAGTSTSAGQVLSVSADGKTLTFRAAIDVQGTIRVTKTVPTFTGLDPTIFLNNTLQLATTDTLHVPGVGTRHLVDYAYGFNTDSIFGTGGSTKIGAATVTTANPGDVVTLNLGGLPGSLGTTAGTVPFAFLANTRVFIGGVEAGIIHTSSSPPVAAIGADSNSVQILVPAHLTPPAGKTTLPITITNTALNFDPTYLFGVAQVSTTTTQAGSPAIMVVGTMTGTGNTAPVTNYAGVGTRGVGATLLPDLPIFPSTAANSRAIVINDANAFFPATGDCNLGIFTTAVAPTGRTVGGCKIYRLAFQTTKVVEAELRWATGVAGADLSVFTLAETGNTGTLIQAPCQSTAPTGTNINVAGCVTGSVLNTTGGKQQGTALVNAALPAAPTITSPSVTAVNGQYVVIVWYSSNGSVAPAWTSLRLTIR